MLNEKQIERMLGKLAKFEEKLGTMLFDKVDELPMLRTEECGPLDAPPADDAFRPFADGETWGGEGKYCWLKGCYTVPQELDGKTLFLAPKSTFYEAMLWVDGQPFGTFCNKKLSSVTDHAVSSRIELADHELDLLSLIFAQVFFICVRNKACRNEYSCFVNYYA